MDNKRRSCATDLTDNQWEAIAYLFYEMRHRQWLKRELVNAILYKADNGCKWRNLPHDFPPWQIKNRVPEAAYGIIDSQSVKTVSCNEERGIDGGKK